jgi:hypothetical protein
MRAKLRKRKRDHPVSQVRIEPSFAPTHDPSGKSGTIRAISVEEYKKQIEDGKIEDAKKGDNIAGMSPNHQSDFHPHFQSEKSILKRLTTGVWWIVFACVNIGLLYFEMQPKSLKPTFYVGTPWGVAEILTPWGPDDIQKVAQLGIRKKQDTEKENRPDHGGDDSKQ